MEKKRKRKKLFYNVILVIAVAVFLFSACKIGMIFYKYYLQDNEKSQLTKKANVKEDPEKEPFTIDWKALKEVNEDIIAWVLIPDTNISYPVVQGRDNTYYLTHTAEKKELYSGAIFLDASATPNFLDRHTIMYGHNVLYGTMFAEIEKFKDEAFFKDHPYVYIFTPDKNYRCLVLSMYTTQDASQTYVTQFATDEDFQQYISRIESASDFQSEHHASVQDRILTLSTCSYEKDGEPSDLRYVLQTKIVEWNNETLVDQQ